MVSAAAPGLHGSDRPRGVPRPVDQPGRGDSRRRGQEYSNKRGNEGGRHRGRLVVPHGLRGNYFKCVCYAFLLLYVLLSETAHHVYIVYFVTQFVYILFTLCTVSQEENEEEFTVAPAEQAAAVVVQPQPQPQAEAPATETTDPEALTLSDKDRINNALGLMISLGLVKDTSAALSLIMQSDGYKALPANEQFASLKAAKLQLKRLDVIPQDATQVRLNALRELAEKARKIGKLIPLVYIVAKMCVIK